MYRLIIHANININSFRYIEVLRQLHCFAISQSPYFHECNKNNRHDTKRDNFVLDSKILNNQHRFISLFVNINEMAKAYENLQSSKKAKPALRKELIHN